MKVGSLKVLIAAGVVICFGVGAIAYKNARFEQGAVALKMLDYKTAFERLEPLAAFGDSTAQYLLGQLFAFGLGVKKDDEQALMWFRKAAWEYTGQQDKASAAEYYVALEYAENGGLVERNDTEALKWFRRSAEGGHRPAAAYLGRAYGEGLLGLPQDKVQSQSWRDRANQNR